MVIVVIVVIVLIVVIVVIVVTVVTVVIVVIVDAKIKRCHLINDSVTMSPIELSWIAKKGFEPFTYCPGT